MNIKSVVQSLLFIILNLTIIACGKLNQPTETKSVRQVKMEIVDLKYTPPQTDSTYYFQAYVQWNNSTSWWDTLKADSLARWLAASKYDVTDMWFVGSFSRCGRLDNTYNYVTVKLSAPSSEILSLGFQPKYKGPFDGCFELYRHYSFTKNN